MIPTGQSQDSPYLRACRGRLRGVLRWDELDALWVRLQCLGAGGWYVYVVGEAPPTMPASRDEFERFLADIRRLLHERHKEDYCGIVYADDHDEPSFVKIYDPDNLGMVCGSSDSPPLPGWTVSRVAPDNLQEAFPRPDTRRHWWQRILR